MSKFARQLNNLEKLEQRTNEPLPQWWTDLLSLWRPSGVSAGDDGLRLAIRDGYLNFYRCGQSIANVKIDRNGIPHAITHCKYVYGRSDKSLGQKYVQLRGDCIFRSGEKVQSYSTINDVAKWISRVNGDPSSKGFSGDEKKFVDELVTANPNIIDLEMGLPAEDGGKRRAPRIDLVAIEAGKVVFWEAKLVKDGRMRTRGDVVLDGAEKMPEVLNQLHDYKEFLAVPANRELVATAYKETFNILSRLWKLAGRSDSNPAIWAPGIQPNDLGVNPYPRLVIDNRSDNKSWPKHAGRLDEAKVPMLPIGPDDSLVLRIPSVLRSPS